VFAGIVQPMAVLYSTTVVMDVQAKEEYLATRLVGIKIFQVITVLMYVRTAVGV